VVIKQDRKCIHSVILRRIRVIVVPV